MIRLIALLFATATAAPELVGGWIREAPPNAKVLAGYGELRNHGARLVVTGAHSADFERVEIHQMSMAGGVMKMRALERVELAPGEELALEPGATHLMLIGPKRALHAGDRVEITFDATPPIAASFVVK